MIAFFFYIDAVNTVISMSTSYGAELGIDSTQLVVALLVTQFVAFPCAILYGRLAGRFGCKVMITAAVVAYMCIVFFAAFFLKSAVEFWILAILVGMFQGGIQALSRSYYGKIIPKDHANEYYGFYDIFGKTASIIGTFLVATTTSLTGNARSACSPSPSCSSRHSSSCSCKRTRRGSDLPALGNSAPRATSRNPCNGP